MTDRQTTHAPGCWSWCPKHYECAVGHVERDTALLRQALEVLRELEGREQRDEAIRAIRDRLNETCEHEPVLVETLLGDWQFCKHCNRSWTTEMEKAYMARTKPTPLPPCEKD